MSTTALARSSSSPSTSMWLTPAYRRRSPPAAGQHGLATEDFEHTIDRFDHAAIPAGQVLWCEHLVSPGQELLAELELFREEFQRGLVHSNPPSVFWFLIFLPLIFLPWIVRP
jgi:hypothetical protein